MDSIYVDKVEKTLDCYTSTAQLLGHRKKQKRAHVSTIAVGWLYVRKKPTKPKHVKKINVLFDSGCSATLVKGSFLEKISQRKITHTTWNTKAGTFSTTRKCKCKFMLPEFHAHRLIEWEVYVDDSTSLSTYDMIIGRDLMDSIGLDLLFSENLMRWDNATVPMRDTSLFDEPSSNPFQELLSMHDPITTEAERIQ